MISEVMYRAAHKSRRGFVLAVTAALIIVLCGFAGLALDAGYLFYLRSRAQTAADSAALAGAHTKKKQGNYTAAAQESAGMNGFTDGEDGTVVTVTSPPASGYYSGSGAAVEVTVTRTTPSFFLGALNITSMTAPARSVARVGPSPNCVYALDPSMSAALAVSGSASVTLECGVQVNSSSSSAMSLTGSSCLTATAYNIVGNYSWTGSNCALTPAPVVDASYEEDPLGYLTPPSVGGCNYTDFDQEGGTVILSPGVYCGGMYIRSAATVTFQPGVYIINGGRNLGGGKGSVGLRMEGGSTISGTGVIFYLTYDGVYPYLPVQIAGNSDLTLKAPTTGAYAGILMFQDRSVSGGAPSLVAGTSSAHLEGALYFPSTQLSFSGNSNSAAPYTVIVAKNLLFTGNSRLKRDYAGLNSGSPLRGPVVLGE